MNAIRIEVSYDFLKKALAIPEEVNIALIQSIENRAGFTEFVLISKSFPEVPNGGIIPKYDCIFSKHEGGVSYAFRPRAEIA